MFEEILSIFGICGILPIFFFAILLGAIIFISTYSESDTVSMLLMILLLIFLEGMVTVWMFSVNHELTVQLEFNAYKDLPITILIVFTVIWAILITLIISLWMYDIYYQKRKLKLK